MQQGFRKPTYSEQVAELTLETPDGIKIFTTVMYHTIFYHAGDPAEALAFQLDMGREALRAKIPAEGATVSLSGRFETITSKSGKEYIRGTRVRFLPFSKGAEMV